MTTDPATGPDRTVVGVFASLSLRDAYRLRYEEQRRELLSHVARSLALPARLLEPPVPSPTLPLALALDDTYQAFLRAIHADPENDLPRLVLADYLEEGAVTEECGRCGGQGKIGDDQRHLSPAIGRWWWSFTAGNDVTYDRQNRVTICNPCGGLGVVPDARTRRARQIRSQCEDPRHHRTEIGTGAATVTVGCRRGFVTDVRGPLNAVRQTLWKLLPVEWPAGSRVGGGLTVTDKVPQRRSVPGLGEQCRWVPVNRYEYGHGHESVIPYRIHGWLPDADAAARTLARFVWAEAGRIADYAVGLLRQGYGGDDVAGFVPSTLRPYEEWSPPDALPRPHLLGVVFA